MNSSTVAGALILWAFLSWLTHIVVCIKTASWMFLLAGAIFFPVACVHGTGYWLGIF
jgi:hypothetical protein